MNSDLIQGPRRTNRDVSSRTLVLLTILVFAAVFANDECTAQNFTITPIGLDDLEHTRNDGYQFTLLNFSGTSLNGAGHVIGGSNRYNGGSSFLGRSAWRYDGATTANIGLTGLEHTRNDGYRNSDVARLNETGYVVGSSLRYNGGSSYLGVSAWLYDGTTTTDIGLTGTEHTRNDGLRGSSGGTLLETGEVFGYSSRYNGGSIDLGTTAWLYDGTTTTDIGLTGLEHTRNDGYKFSQGGGTGATNAVGFALRFNGGSSDLGRSAWYYDGTTTTDIGLTGLEHTRNDGYKSSVTQGLNEAGNVIGVSLRFNGSSNLGQSAWHFDGTTTTDIGLTGTEHTRNDGYKDSQIVSSASVLNEAGNAFGYSERYNGGSTYLGRSAWSFDGTSTTNIGLTGTEHTRDTGHKFSVANDQNEAGNVIGRSQRYNGGNSDLGQSAWYYDGTTTSDIGLTGTEHTRNTGYKDSIALGLNEAGQVIGNSNRYNGGSSFLGQSAWFFDGTTTTDIGLIGTEHTRSTGLRMSEVTSLNELGNVIGNSNRYNGGSNYLGQSAWFYDSVLDLTTELSLSERISDGYSFTEAEFLGEDNLVLGFYELFDLSSTLLGERAFYFKPGEGLFDLGALVDGGLAANDWAFLASAIETNGLGQIIGIGQLSSDSLGQMAYQLNPAGVPEPSSLMMLGFVAVGLLHRRRNRSSLSKRLS